MLEDLTEITALHSLRSQHETLVSVKEVSRYYGKNKAVDNISFDVKRGEVLGLLGPNGAGKSTAMQMITGNLAPSNGQITINNFDILDKPKNAKANLGYLPEQPPVYKELTVDEYLTHCSKINRIAHSHQRDAITLAKERCGLNSMSKRLIGNLSKGYQQRVGIAQAIIHSPAVIVLDEPTVGLDPRQIREIRSLIRELGNDHSIILSTHILPEVTATCDRVLIINRGKIMVTETIIGLQQRIQSSSLIVAFQHPPSNDELSQFDGVLSVDKIELGRYRLHHVPEIDPSENIVNQSVNNNWRLTEITPEKLSLEEIFMDITCTENEDIDMTTKAEETV
ncbi:MAG: ABC transporter ATP-binding protein [Gammaproteobacteria bacterium]|nr:ABC transporter ATP-binding protein [Gammaproteobacteria bacterium]